jgi:Flp pilus assembly protein TadG
MAGIGTRNLILEIEGTDYSDAVSSVKVVAAAADSDFLSFSAAALGGARKYTLDMTLKQDLAAASLFRQLWDNAGSTVDVVVKPNGGTAASATTSTLTGTAIVSEPDGDYLGGDSNASTTSRFVTSVSWEFTAKPVLDATP